MLYMIFPYGLEPVLIQRIIIDFEAIRYIFMFPIIKKNIYFQEFGPMEDFFKQHFAQHKIQTEMHGGVFNFGSDINFEDMINIGVSLIEILYPKRN